MRGLTQVYQGSGLSSVLVVRAREVDPASLGQAAVGVIRGVDPELPVYAVRTMDDVVARSIGTRRLLMLLVGFFAVCAVTLAALGIYGVMAFVAERRRREIGIRLAVGATRNHVLRQMVGSGMVLTLLGIAAGLAGAAGTAQLLQGLLFGLTLSDLVTWIAAPALVAAVSLIACAGPAWRASLTDPAITLRADI